MGLIAEVAEVKQELKQCKNVLEEEKKEKEKKEKMKKKEKARQDYYKYIKDLQIGVKIDLQQEIEKQYKIQGLKAKYYFYNIENREATIKNLLTDITEGQTLIYDYLNNIFDKTLTDIDKKYIKQEEYIKQKEIEKQEEYIKTHAEEIKKALQEQEKQEQKEKTKNILIEIFYNFINILFSPIGIIIILFILFWWGYIKALPIINS